MGKINTRIFRKLPNSKGVTLVELMIGTVILTVGVLGFLGVFGNISKSIHFSRGRTISNNLAQEKIESMKNISYHRLLVTQSTATATESGLGGFRYDDTFYAPETLSVGKKTFQRRVLVEKVTETAGVLIANNWDDDDTGLKKITVYVIWQDGSEWKKVTLTNLRDNVNRRNLDATLVGYVESGGSDLQDAAVFTLQNVGLRDATDSDGDYSISVPAGTYILKARKSGYFSHTKSVTVASGGTETVDFDLSQMGAGTVTGTAYVNDHLVISQVVGAAQDGTNCQEYIEVFNPSTYTWTMASDPTTAVVNLRVQREGDAFPTTIPMTLYVTLTMAPSSYYLFANYATINAVSVTRNADAYYAGNYFIVDSGGGFCAEAGPNTADSVGLAWASDDSWIDYVGWGTGGNDPPLFEGTAIAQGIGLQDEEQFVRFSNSGGYTSGEGPAYDSGNNSADFVVNRPMTVPPKNSSDVDPIVSGTPAEGALIFVDDGLSTSGVAAGDGSFSITNVATGTWSVLVSSSSLVYENTSVTVTDGGTTVLGTVILTSGTTNGFISGRVVDNGSNGLPNILVEGAGAQDTTNALGYFSLAVDGGTKIVTANPDNDDPTYTETVSTGVVVNAGQLTNVGDMVLFSGGKIRGWVTTNGTDPLPNIPLVSTSSATGAESSSQLTDYLGYFEFPDLPVGDYTITPQLDTGESATPGSFTDTVTAGNTLFIGTFTVSNAFATIIGTVTSGGSLIDTGVIILAVDSSIPVGNDPPTIDDSLRTGSTLYYLASSNAEGEYSVAVRGGITYTVHGWYTTIANGVTTTVRKFSNISPSAGDTVSVDLSW